MIGSQKPVGLFFAIFPNPQAAERIAQLTRHLRVAHRLRGQPLLTSRFHCSLYGFDDHDAARLNVVAKVKEAGALLAVPPFRVSFNCVQSFSGRRDNRPLVLVGDDGVIGLTRLRSSLCTAMRQVGFRPKGSSAFTPHVTLLYDKSRIDAQGIEPISWTVDEVVLVLSFTGQTKYRLLERWKLRLQDYAEGGGSLGLRLA